MTVEIESLTVDLQLQLYRLERMQATNSLGIRQLRIELSNLLEINKFKIFLFKALKYLHARDNDKINPNSASTFSPLTLFSFPK